MQKVTVWGNLEMYAPIPCGESLAERVGPRWATPLAKASHTHTAWMEYFAAEGKLKSVGGLHMGTDDVNLCAEVGSRTSHASFIAERCSTIIFVAVLMLRARGG
jgi:hypothetical protein